MKAYVRLDIHSKSSTYVVQDERGRELGRGEVPTSPEGLEEMRRRLHLEAGTEVGLEGSSPRY